MTLRISFCIMLLFLAMPLLVSAAPDPPSDLSSILQAARHDPNIELALKVQCTDAQGPRSMAVFPSSILIWEGRRQARLTNDQRVLLVSTLLEAGFSDFEESYGGTLIQDNQSAPLTIMCSIRVRAGGLEMHSFQDAAGARFAPLLNLAGRLLDLVADTGAAGVAADSLEDGLAKLASGKLAPEAMSLQLLHLPSDATIMGTLLEIGDGMIIWQDFRPGAHMGERIPSPMSAEIALQVAAALRTADVAVMPRAMPSEDTYRLSLAILNRSTQVQARPSKHKFDRNVQNASERLESLATTLFSLKLREKSQD